MDRERRSCAKTEKEKRIEKIFENFFVFFSISSIFLLAIYSCGHEIGIALLFLTFPILITLVIIDRKYKFLFCYGDCKGSICKTFAAVCRVFGIVTCSILFSFSSAGYISFFNSVLPPQKIFYYSGRVVDKTIKKNKRHNTDYFIITLNVDDHGEEKFYVSFWEFRKIKKNQFYRIKMREGGLGIVCRTEDQIKNGER